MGQGDLSSPVRSLTPKLPLSPPNELTLYTDVTSEIWSPHPPFESLVTPAIQGSTDSGQCVSACAVKFEEKPCHHWMSFHI